MIPSCVPIPSPPSPPCSSPEDGERTVVVHKVGNRNAKDGAVKPRVQAGDALARDDAARGVQHRRVGALRLDLGARRQRDERIRQYHGQHAAAGAADGVEHLETGDQVSRWSAEARGFGVSRTLSLCGVDMVARC